MQNHQQEITYSFFMSFNKMAQLEVGNKGSQSMAFLYEIYAFILSATVKITYGGIVFILLVYYCTCGWKKK